jgi:DNA processing protein
MAHKGALEGGGKTIAVLGCGVDICYPQENEGLREKIIQNGCIISEYPPGTRPLPHYFPARNRIISGLSYGVVVAEAGKKSGTLITVNQAIDQGREVFAVPGNISSPLSNGTNRLISEGAIPVSNHQDILDNLKIFYEEICEEEPAQEIVSKEILAPNEKQVYDSLDFEPVSVETLIENTGLEIGHVLLSLMQLELGGHITKIHGSRYIRT